MEVKLTTAFLTLEEMAAKLRVSIRKLQYMMKGGTAPRHVKLGGKVLFPVVKGDDRD